MASLGGPIHVAFDSLHGLRSCDVPMTRLNHTPHAAAVYARGRRRRRLTQHSLPGCLLSITGRLSLWPGCKAQQWKGAGRYVRSRTAEVMKALMKPSRPSIGKPGFGSCEETTRESVWDRSADQTRASGQVGRAKSRRHDAPERFADRQIPLAPRAPSIHDPGDHSRRQRSIKRYPLFHENTSAWRSTLLCRPDCDCLQ